MPTTLREQLLVGIHQTEKQLARITNDPLRRQLATELDAYLDEVRAAANEDSDAIRPLYEKLLPLHQRIVQAR